MNRCLVVGYGNIAKIHSKYLALRDFTTWDWYDPYVDGGLNDLNEIGLYNNIFILTPEHTHYSVYEDLRLRGYKENIFIEKPAVLNSSHFDIFDDDKVFFGLVERYNPAIETLIANFNPDNMVSVDFSRCCVSDESSGVELLEDIAIHDLDLLVYMLQGKVGEDNLIGVCNNRNTCIATYTNGFVVRFLWSKDTFFKERKIIVRQTDCTFDVDLQDQIVTKYYYHKGKLVSESLFVEKASPIFNEHNHFFDNNKSRQMNFKKSHEVLLDLMEKGHNKV